MYRPIRRHLLIIRNRKSTIKSPTLVRLLPASQLYRAPGRLLVLHAPSSFRSTYIQTVSEHKLSIGRKMWSLAFLAVSFSFIRFANAHLCAWNPGMFCFNVRHFYLRGRTSLSNRFVTYRETFLVKSTTTPMQRHCPFTCSIRTITGSIILIRSLHFVQAETLHGYLRGICSVTSSPQLTAISLNCKLSLI